jgi:D-alanyl-D-alanine carboxypeptidase/D-alanyl-D-alanine-endopeptidase (penicillin-binding protein 4)
MALLLIALAASAARAAGSDVGALGERLEAVLGSETLRRARVSALVARESDGQVLYARSPDRALVPASNVKILTAIASLDAFGPTHRFETLVSADREPDAAGAVGALRVVGSGDPVLNSEDWWRLAAALRNRGLRRVEGGLHLDDSAFDRDRWHASWGQTSARAYHAPVGALTANYGAFSVTVRAGARQGDPVQVAVDPPVATLRVENRARTGSPEVRPSLVVDRKAAVDSELVVVAGVVRAGDAPRTLYRSVLDPTRYAGAVLRMQLEANGIIVEGPTRVAGSDLADQPETPVELLRFEGRQLSEIVRLFVKYSNNAVAESLVKALGARRDGGVGTWRGGTAELTRRLVGLGLDPKGFQLVDGSGLSYQNRVSARTMVRALRLARDSFRFGPELVAALPIAARDGTLEERAERAAGEVRAKTGLLNGVTALSGFALLEGGDRAVFSILVNGYRVSDEQAMEAVDRFVAELVRPAGERGQPERLEGG